jgi:diguanylate cyclase (GGDEF)-like protein
MFFDFEPTSPDRGRRTPPGFRLGRALRGCAGWIVYSPGAQPPEIQRMLLRQSLTKAWTLVVSVVASSLMASVAVLMTAAVWAYLWLLAELVVGSFRIASTNAFVKAETSGRTGNSLAPIFGALVSFIIISAGACQCVASGEWPLIAMAGMGIATLIGAVSSRNAGTPRYGVVLIAILTLPFSLAALVSPMPYLFMAGVQLPLYACGVIFVMLENYKVLLTLYRSEAENRRLAHHDLLTGLPNRSMNLKRFDELLAGLSSAPDGTQNGFTVFCLDLDGFKDVNDRLGHAAGDAVLIALADRLRQSVRTCDFVSRTGGDEFVVPLPDISAAEAATIAERIIAHVGTLFDVGHGEPVEIGISIGSAAAPADGETTDALMRSADQAMYEAKKRGKGRFVPYGTLGTDAVELVPAADADARIAETVCPGDGGRNRHFPLPSRAKSL